MSDQKAVRMEQLLKQRIRELSEAIGQIRVLASGQATLAEKNILQICNRMRADV